jgi:diguanylate cyclase (GGDEF)-like protein/PAS domain S-box-containing protein
MAKPSDDEDEWRLQRDRIIGLGERSVHKNYYPQLRRNLAELKNLAATMEQAPLGLAILSRGGTIEFVNTAFGAVAGQPVGWMTGRDLIAACGGADNAEFCDRITAALENGTGWQGELTFRRADGQTVWGRFAVLAIRDESGAVTHCGILAEDISAQRAAEERLRLAAQVFASSHDGIIVTDARSSIVDVNEAFERMTGYSLDDVRGQKPSVLRSRRYDEAFFRGMWDSLLETGHWEGEIWNRRKGGGLYPQWTSISAIRDSGGQVSHYVGICTDITERKTAEARIQHMAYHDELTSLPNRFLLGHRFTQAAGQARRSGSMLALFYVDLDRFKNVNDILGHSFGDKILRAAAQRLTRVLRPTDTVSRQGGDEFIALAGDLTGAEEARALAERILTAMAEPYQIDGHELSVPPSIGVALHPVHGEDLETLQRRGDTAMYHAKKLGRSRVLVFEESMDEATLEFFRIENALRGALKRREFALHYQPQIELATGRCVGYEALLRWHHAAELGSVTPDRFIPVAEETGMILPIGSWVLETGCLQTAEWLGRGREDARVAVNLSMIQLRQDDLVETVRRALDLSGLPPERLELEVTESALMVDADQTILTLKRLRDLGVGLAIDDFGTGYSSLAYLKRFPVDKLKIDQSFVRELTATPEGARICRAVIGLAEAFRLRVVAEGVETEEQRRWLHDEGCDLGQGYLFARPRPGGEI